MTPDPHWSEVFGAPETDDAVMTPAFTEWADAGFGAELVRVSPPDDPGPSAGKRPLGDGWQAAEITPAMLQAWSRGRYNVGLRTRPFPVLDIDVDDPAIAAVVAAVAVEILGPAPQRWRENSARSALLYRLHGVPFEKAKIMFTLPSGGSAGVEVLGAGQQLVVAGVHHTGARLEWHPRPRASDLTPIDAAARDRFLAALRSRLVELGCTLKGTNGVNKAVHRPPAVSAFTAKGWAEDGDLAEEALRNLDPDLDYDSWIKVGMALHSKAPEPAGPAFHAWDTWSSGGTKYPGTRALERHWLSFESGKGVGFGTLLAMAGVTPRKGSASRTAVPTPAVTTDTAHARRGEADPAPVLAGEAPEDLEDLRTAARLVERAQGRFLWVYRQGGGAWHGWDRHRWGRDDARGIFELCAEVARSFLVDASNVSGERQKALMAHARRAQQAQRLEAAVRLAATAFPDLKAPASSFDTDEWTINTLSGLVNLRTGDQRPPTPADRVTLLAPVEYDPEARSERFERFLREVLPSPEVRAYVQRAAGYTITASTREHAMFLPVGGGRNGKGVLMRLLLRALGDYARTAAAGLLLERHGGEAHLTELASLDGARFVFASEVPPRSRWNEPRLKQLTGGDPVTARFMRQDEFTFMPRCKVWLAMNERPKVVGTSDAIWSRLKEIPFPVQFRDADDPRPEVQRQPVKDPRLEEELVPEALPAVLAWAVAGALEWQRKGLGEPPEVREAVQEYRTTQDHVGPFLAEHPVTDKVRLREVFTAWTAWCAEENEKPGSQADLAAALRAKGFLVKLGHGKVTYVYPLELPLMPRTGGAGECLPPGSDLVRIARARETLIPETLPQHSPAPPAAEEDAP